MANKQATWLLVLAACATAAPVSIRDVTVDDTATRSAWVAEYNNKPAHGPDQSGPSVDETATRSQWVSSYNNKPAYEPGQSGPSVDETATRSQWVSSYKAPHEADHPDADTTVSGMPHFHSPGAYAWMPSGPGYLDLSSYDLPHTNWLAVPMAPLDHSPSIWGSIRRFFAGRV